MKEPGNARITLMFSAFEGAPKIVRLFGHGECSTVTSHRLTLTFAKALYMSSARLSMIHTYRQVPVAQDRALSL